MDIEKIVDYSFERKEKSNVLAIHPTRPLIAYLINIQRAQKISKAWSSGNDPTQSPSASSHNVDKNKTVSIRIIDYVTRQRCLAKGIYHARPADCVFTINSLLCSQSDIFKLAVVDRLANIYLYDLSYFLNDLTATRIAVIRGPAQDVTPYEYISLVWCPFVPCEDFDDGDGGLRLALATNSKIEIFAIDRLQGKTGELQREDLKGHAYKCINEAHKAHIVSLSISPDCSTISAAALDNRVTFFSSDIDDGGQRCLHEWEASITDKSSISKLFFLDNYPKLLEDSTMKFWGAAFIGTRSGQMLLVDLRTWSIYQKMNLACDGPKNFDYRIDITCRTVIAMNGSQCYVVKIEQDMGKKFNTSGSIHGSGQNDVSLIDVNYSEVTMNGNIFEYLSKSSMETPRQNERKSNSHKQSGSHSNSHSTNEMNELPRIVKTTKLSLYNPIYSFVIKHKSDNELELFTISAYSLERCTINLNAITSEVVEETPISTSFVDEPKPSASTPHGLTRFLQQFDGNLKISSSGTTPVNVPAQVQTKLGPTMPNLTQFSSTLGNISTATTATTAPPAATLIASNVNNTINNNGNDLVAKSSISAASVDVVQMDKMVEALFTKLNTAFGQGLEEFLNDVKCEVNDLKLKLNGLCRDVRKLQQQLQETRQK